jgi:hypothetical protein
VGVKQETGNQESPGILTPARRSATGTALVIAAFAALIITAHLWGNNLNERGVRIGLDAPPLFGRLDPRLSWRILPAVAFAGLVVGFGRRAARDLSWPALLGLSFAGSGLWAVLLAASAGFKSLTAPVLDPNDALAVLPRIGSIHEFLGTFTERIATFPIHVQGHPPGLPVLLSLLDRLSLASPGVVAGIYIVAGAAIAPAVLTAVRSVAGEQCARLAAPFLILAPYAIWVATSADALYAGVGACGVAMIISAGREQRWKAAAGGMVLGIALFLTYGAAPLVLLPLTLAVVRRSFRALWYAAGGAVAVTAAFAAAGFWWLDGLAATHRQYYAGLGGLRPYQFFVFANLAALAIAAGPATMRGFSILAGRRRRLPTAQKSLGWLVGAAAVAVAAANLSGLSKGEVERIWLVFTPWLVVAAAAIPGVNARRLWLGAGAVVALAVQSFVVTPW